MRVGSGEPCPRDQDLNAAFIRRLATGPQALIKIINEYRYIAFRSMRVRTAQCGAWHKRQPGRRNSMAIQGSVTIKVKDDALLSAASTLKDRISDMRSSYDKVMEIVQKTSGYWIGLAGDAHRNAFLEQQDDIEQIVKRLSEHPDDLLKIANLYVETEKKTAEIPGGLGSVLIS